MVQFEWDKAKARANVAKHGISFEDAKEAFRDPFALELVDDRFDYGEERLVLIARTRRGCLTVVHVERGGMSRLISARPSTRAEEHAYFQAQTG
jgi:uncharacterized DUF497 family protein